MAKPIILDFASNLVERPLSLTNPASSANFYVTFMPVVKQANSGGEIGSTNLAHCARQSTAPIVFAGLVDRNKSVGQGNHFYRNKERLNLTTW